MGGYVCTDRDSLDHLLLCGETLANAIKYYFFSVSQDLPSVDPKIFNLLTATELTADFVIKLYEIAQRLNKLNIYKAPGPDGLPCGYCNNVHHI